MRIDGLQFANWSPTVFGQMREGGLDAVHVTVAYHGGFRETVLGLEAWNRRFADPSNRIVKGLTADDVDRARRSGCTAIVLGLQNPSPIEDDLGLVEILHTLGIRFMQLTYNNQSLLAGGCQEVMDGGITRMGRQVIREMNRVGMVVDMSHSGERSTLEAVDLSTRPIAITHANPDSWAPARRNKSDDVIRAVIGGGGMLGFSLYPHHLRRGSECTLGEFCEMIARTAEVHGTRHLGIGSDLCQDQPDSVVRWMRNGRWCRETDGTDSTAKPKFPAMPTWFRDNRDFRTIETGLRDIGLSGEEVAGIMGENWYRFFQQSFSPVPS